MRKLGVSGIHTTVNKAVFASAFADLLISVMSRGVEITRAEEILLNIVIVALLTWFLPPDFPVRDTTKVEKAKAERRASRIVPIVAFTIGAIIAALLLGRAVAHAETGARGVIYSETSTVWQPAVDDITGEETGELEGFVVDRPVLYIDLGVSLNFVVLDLATREYSVGVSPGVGYGLKYAPEWWTVSPVFLALDFFVSARVVDIDNGLDGPDIFEINFLPSLVIADWFAVGVGPKFNLSLRQNVPDKIVPVLTFALAKGL